MKIKICGITSVAEADYLNDNKVDYAGFVFYEKSKRNVSLEQARLIFERLEPDMKKVAVMVSPTLEEFIEKENESFDIIQIHGKLDPGILDMARKDVWCAINLSEDEFREKIAYVESLSDKQLDRIKGVVIDSKNFGSGEAFDWQKNKDKLSTEIIKDKTFILAGGLNKDNVGEAASILKPDIIDVSSGVEISKDKTGKDKRLIEQFVEAARM